ncbi:MAG: hypothetical protein D6725_15375 [Planctomycetota bacterium]|nr:MAG: hypothetical protein D6725_15375 [Planctomycetota bacterium]
MTNRSGSAIGFGGLKRRVVAMTAAAMAGGAILFLVLTWVFPWAHLNCVQQDVDINSGRIRTVRFLFWMRLSERVRETWLSRAARARGAAEWRRVNTFSAGRGYSPHYLYHSAINQIKTLERLDELTRFTPAARAQISARVLELWQQGSDDAAEAYIRRLSGVVVSAHRAGRRTLSVRDLGQADVGRSKQRVEHR